MKRQHFQILLVLAIAALAIGCGGGAAANSNAGTAAKPVASPAATGDDDKKGLDEDQTDAINEFVESNYPGWTLQGMSGSDDPNCSDNVPCYLHLTQKDQNEVVPVILREFQKKDGSTYWFVYKATPVDLGKARIDQLKDSIRSDVFANLTQEQCEPLFYGRPANAPIPKDPDTDD